MKQPINLLLAKESARRRDAWRRFECALKAQHGFGAEMEPAEFLAALEQWEAREPQPGGGSQCDV